MAEKINMSASMKARADKEKAAKLKKQGTRESRRAAWWQNKQKEPTENSEEDTKSGTTEKIPDGTKVVKSRQGFILGTITSIPAQTKPEGPKKRKTSGDITSTEEPVKKKKSKKKKPKAEPEGKTDDEVPKKQEKQKKKRHYVLFLGNLPFDVTEEEVKKHFHKAGTVEAVRLLTNMKTGRPRGCGYIEFADTDSHRKALLLHESELKGRKVNVEFTSAGRKTEKRMEMLREKNKALARYKTPLPERFSVDNPQYTALM